MLNILSVCLSVCLSIALFRCEAESGSKLLLGVRSEPKSSRQHTLVHRSKRGNGASVQPKIGSELLFLNSNLTKHSH
jgi:hypothetical protein